MCGISGFYDLSNSEMAGTTLSRMINVLKHRGPDEMGTWLSPNQRVGLANTRLAIIDIESGKQPMHSSNDQCIIVFNGEIYNFQALRKNLLSLGRIFYTNSDTEVLLEAYREWGKACLERLHGMFAFAVYDSNKQTLFLARDPLGIKPLYYHKSNVGFFFGSEIKSLLSVEKIPRRISYDALVDYLVLSYPLMPKTFFRDIRELEPGTWLEIGPNGLSTGCFWKWKRTPCCWKESIAVQNVETALSESLQEHIVADVPLGAFLSGGIDSSLLVALLVQKLGLKLHTFNVKFEEAGYDESPYARAVAQHFGTDHHELVVRMKNADFDLLDDVVLQFDQPFGDSSAIPTFLISREIRKHVKVALGGDGGDEMFGGYPRFRIAELAARFQPFPFSNIKFVSGLISPLKVGIPSIYRKSYRFLSAMSAGEERLMYLSCYVYPENIANMVTDLVLNSVRGYIPSLVQPDVKLANPGGEDFIDATIQYALPGDYLRKIDMMSSAHGLEVRVPFLGKQVVTSAAKLPKHLKYSNCNMKLALKSLASHYLPEKILKKPKFGFGIPFDSWLGQTGRDLVCSKIGSRNSMVSVLIQPKYMRSLLTGFKTQKWDSSEFSRFNLYQQVYFLYCLEAWLQKWKPSF